MVRNGTITALKVLTAWCDVSLVRIQIRLTLNVAETWMVGTECNNLLMLSVCIGRRRFGGHYLGVFGHDGCMHMRKSFLSKAHMSINSELLAPSSGVFYVQGTTTEHVLATIVGPSSKPDGVAIQYEQCGHSRLYAKCSLDRWTFLIKCVDSPPSDSDGTMSLGTAVQCALVPALAPSSSPSAMAESFSFQYTTPGTEIYPLCTFKKGSRPHRRHGTRHGLYYTPWLAIWNIAP